MKKNLCSALVVLAAAGVEPALADLFRVGPGGSHTTIQAAVDAALATPGGDTIRVAEGSRVERIEILENPAAPNGNLVLSGGWLAPAYIARSDAFGATEVSAAGSGRPLHVDCVDGDVTIDGFTFRDGRVDETDVGSWGGGALLVASGACQLVFTRNRVIANRAAEVVAEPTRGAAGGGLAAGLWGGGSLIVTDNVVEANEIASADHAVAGGAHFSIGADSTFSITGNRFLANRVTAAGQANASGAAIEFYDGPSSGDFSDNWLLDGVVDGSVTVVGAAKFGSPSGTANRLTLHRNRILRNEGGDDFSPQVLVWAGGSSEFVLSDSLIADSESQAGIALSTHDAADIVVGNLTVSGNAGGPGIEASGAGSASIEVWNSISFGNGTNDQFAGGTERHAHFTADPHFVAAARGDYHLRLDSPAINAGLAGVPGGLGPADLDLGPRVRGAAVDAGAYEHHSARGPACEVRGFGPVPFVDRFAPVCACLRDDGLRTSRCGGFAQPMFFDVVIPPVPGPFGEVEVRIRPWELGGGNYQLAAQLLHASKIDPVEIVGPKSGKFHAGKELKVKLRYLTTGSTATLRLAMRYRPDGEQELRETWFDLRIDPDQPQP